MPRGSVFGRFCDEVHANPMIFVEKRFRQDVGIMLKTYRWRILMRTVWFGPLGRPNTMSILKFIPEGMVFVELPQQATLKRL